MVTVTGGGSRWATINSLTVGDWGTGALNIDGGGEVSNALLDGDALPHSDRRFHAHHQRSHSDGCTGHIGLVCPTISYTTSLLS